MREIERLYAEEGGKSKSYVLALIGTAARTKKGGLNSRKGSNTNKGTITITWGAGQNQRSETVQASITTTTNNKGTKTYKTDYYTNHIKPNRLLEWTGKIYTKKMIVQFNKKKADAGKVLEKPIHAPFEAKAVLKLAHN